MSSTFGGVLPTTNDPKENIRKDRPKERGVHKDLGKVRSRVRIRVRETRNGLLTCQLGLVV